jgi:hypothetical protein
MVSCSLTLSMAGVASLFTCPGCVVRLPGSESMTKGIDFLLSSKSLFRPSLNNLQLLGVATACQMGSSMEPATCKCSNKLEGRNLVVCIDGTSNQFGEQVRVCIPLAAFLYLIFVAFIMIEHQCCWIVQQDCENGGFETTHLLQQRHWHIRESFLDISEVPAASRRQQRGSCNCLVRITRFGLS